MDPGSDAYRGDGDEILDPGAQMHTGMTGERNGLPAHGQRANELRVARIGW